MITAPDSYTSCSCIHVHKWQVDAPHDPDTAVCFVWSEGNCNSAQFSTRSPQRQLSHKYPSGLKATKILIAHWYCSDHKSLVVRWKGNHIKMLRSKSNAPGIHWYSNSMDFWFYCWSCSSCGEWVWCLGHDTGNRTRAYIIIYGQTSLR